MTNKDAEDHRLRRFRKLPKPLRVVYARPRTFVAAAVGIATGLLLPESFRIVTRGVIGWDVAASIYLVPIYLLVFRGGIGHIRRNAVMQDEGRFLILVVIALGAFASIAAIVLELGAKDRGTIDLVLAIVTVTLSWAMVHTTFALHYAHEYYRDDGDEGGLTFPQDNARGDDRKREEPDYWDFVYFSFVVGTTAQTSDVGITEKTMRRIVTVHGVVSFIFNTALVALMVNIAASAI